jgi:hypothetical protein
MVCGPAVASTFAALIASRKLMPPTPMPSFSSTSVLTVNVVGTARSSKAES